MHLGPVGKERDEQESRMLTHFNMVAPQIEAAQLLPQKDHRAFQDVGGSSLDDGVDCVSPA